MSYQTYQRTSPACIVAPMSERPQKKPRFADRAGYKPATDVMETWIAHGYTPPSIERVARNLFDADKAWEQLAKRLESL